MTVSSILKSRDALNHVLKLQRLSLANYLQFARPWTRHADCNLWDMVSRIAAVQMQNAARVSELLVERHARIDPGTFPARFTGLNDLSIEYVALRVVEDLERIIRDLRSCEDVLRGDGPAWDLVKAILRDEGRQLEMLRKECHPSLEKSGASRDIRHSRSCGRGSAIMPTSRSNCSIGRLSRSSFIPVRRRRRDDAVV